ISVEDPVSGQARAITATVDDASGMRSAASDTRPALTVGSIRSVTWLGAGEAVEFRSWDPATRIVTVDQYGPQRMFVIEPDALVPGQNVLLSWRFGKSGKPEAVIRTVPARAAARTLGGPSAGVTTSPVRMRGPVEVLSTNPANRTLKVRDERGMTVVLPVDEKAVASLEGVKAGDLIVLSWRNDRVTLITRK